MVDGSAVDSEVRPAQKRKARATQREQEIPQWVPVGQSRLAVPQVSPGRSPLHVEVVPVPHQPLD